MMKKIEDYQLRELEEDKIFINEYDLDLKYNYEIAVYWKAFQFDIIKALLDKGYILKKELFPILNTTKPWLVMWDIVIDYYKINIDFKDYIEINDYIPYCKWKKDPNHGIAYFENEIFLITK